MARFGLLLDYLERANAEDMCRLRRKRKRSRKICDAFDLPDKAFEYRYRLTKPLKRGFMNELQPFLNSSPKRDSISADTKLQMVHTTCAVWGCRMSSRINKELKFHQFPHTEDRCKVWIEACGRPDLDGRTYDSLKNSYVCSLHFETCMYGKRSLKKTAVPTLFLPSKQCGHTQTNCNCCKTVRDCRYSADCKPETFASDLAMSEANLSSHSPLGIDTRTGSLDTEMPAVNSSLSTRELETDKCDSADLILKIEPETVYLTSHVEPECLACRACLETEGELISIHEMRLTEPFIQITGTQVFESDGMPQHLCVSCAELVRKLAQFRTCARTAQNLLMRALLHHRLITTDFVKTIDRSAFKLLLPEEEPVGTKKKVDNIKTENITEESDCLNIEIEAMDLNVNSRCKNSDTEPRSVENTFIKTEYDDDVNYKSCGKNSVPIAGMSLTAQDHIKKQLLTQTTVYPVVTKNNKKVGATSKRTIINRAIKSDKNSKKAKKTRTIKSHRKTEKVIGRVRKGKKLNQPRWYEVDDQRREFEKEYNVKVIVMDMEQQISNYEARKLSRNYINSPMKCQICYRGFEKRGGYDNHMKTHDRSRGESVCKICHLVFPQPSLLKRHNAQHLLRIECHDCQFTTSLAERAIDHFKAHKGHRYKCEYCGKVYRMPPPRSRGHVLVELVMPQEGNHETPLFSDSQSEDISDNDEDSRCSAALKNSLIEDSLVENPPAETSYPNETISSKDLDFDHSGFIRLCNGLIENSISAPSPIIEFIDRSDATEKVNYEPNDMICKVTSAVMEPFLSSEGQMTHSENPQTEVGFLRSFNLQRVDEDNDQTEFGARETPEAPQDIPENNDAQGSQVNEGVPQRGRKRKYPNQNRNIRKMKTNLNEDYISASGKKVSSRKFNGHLFRCNCPLKCTEQLTVEQRESEFKRFWSAGAFEARCAILQECVKEAQKKRSYSNTSKRQYTRTYYLGNTKVCKKAFLNTLCISQSRIDAALEKYRSKTALTDKRGKNSGGKNAITPQQLQEIEIFIKSLPIYTSHYSDTTTNFLAPNLNVSKIYDIYKEQYQNCVSFSRFRLCFYKEFNFTFKKPQS